MGLDFALDPEQEALVRTIRAFAQRELAPHSARWDRDRVFPAEAWRQMGALGVLGLRVPAALGGQEADLVTVGLVMEEIARGDFSCTYGIQLSTLAGEIIGKRGDAALRERWLPPMTRGEAVIALALTEPSVGSDAARLVMRAERDGGDYLLTGEKSGISLGMAAQAVIVFARTGGTGARGVTAFMVPLDLPGRGAEPAARHGLACHRARGAGLRPRAHPRLAPPRRGGHRLLRGHARLRLQPGADLPGLPRRRADLARGDHGVRQGTPGLRPAPGALRGRNVPIAEAATWIEAARGLCLRALWLADRDAPCTKESAMVKWWVPRLAVDTIHQCLLLHGHYGYTDELPFERRMRDVMGLEIGDGTAEVMKIVVARELLGRGSLPY